MTDLRIKELLHSLGITGKYRGYTYTMIACELALEDETRLYCITSEVYNRIASECECGKASVERNIRTVIMKAWKLRRERLVEMAGLPLSAPPTVSDFIDYLITYIQRTELTSSMR